MPSAELKYEYSTMDVCISWRLRTKLLATDGVRGCFSCQISEIIEIIPSCRRMKQQASLPKEADPASYLALEREGIEVGCGAFDCIARTRRQDQG